MNIILNESGLDSGVSWGEACDKLEADGYLSPRELGYGEEEVSWLSADHARNELLEIGERWDTNAPYWYVPIFSGGGKE